MPTPPWDPTLRPDIAILIALPEEFRTLAADYSDQWYPRPNPDHPGSDYLFVGPSGYRCIATIMPRMGPTVASEVSMRLLGLRPALIVNIGIAGGFKKDDLRIGDIIVPRQVDAYDETGKVEGLQWKRRGSDYRPSAELVADVQELEFTARDDFYRWMKEGAEQLNALCTGPDKERIEKLLNSKLLRTEPVVSTYHLASGNWVVASKPFAEFIREANADIHAGEMEAAGMMAAAEYQRKPVYTLVVRGISDHVDADKHEVDSIGEGALRRLAMANAWRLVCTLMRLGRLPRVDVGTGAVHPVGEGKELDMLVACIEQLLLPEYFTVTKNARRYNHEGEQIAEFGIEIRGKVGSANISWLIECWDPKDGPATAQWIEQLVGRKSHFLFNKITAVSKTGFLAGARDVANKSGIELREFGRLSPDDVKSWLDVCYVDQFQRVAALHHANIDLEDKPFTEEEAVELRRTLSNAHIPFLASSAGEPYMITTAFLNAAKAGALFDDVMPNSPPKSVKFRANYSLPGDPLFVKTSLGLTRVTCIEFRGDLSIKHTQAPLLSLNNYRSLESEISIAHSATFLGDDLKVEIHRITDTGELIVGVQRIQGENSQ